MKFFAFELRYIVFNFRHIKHKCLKKRYVVPNITVLSLNIIYIKRIWMNTGNKSVNGSLKDYLNAKCRVGGEYGLFSSVNKYRV